MSAHGVLLERSRRLELAMKRHVMFCQFLLLFGGFGPLMVMPAETNVPFGVANDHKRYDPHANNMRSYLVREASERLVTLGLAQTRPHFHPRC
jgi:hypothetical protein